MFRNVLHYAKRIVIFIMKVVLAVIPKDQNLILFSAWFGKKYADSSMYMYEYLLKSEFKVFWYTLDKTILEDLKKQGKPVVYGKSLMGLWKQLRAKMLVSSVQFADFNKYLLTRCIYFDLDHGFPIKQSGFEINDSTKKTESFFKLLCLFINYYMTASSLFVERIIERCWKLSEMQIVKCNKPRTDVFFDEKLRIGNNSIVDDIKAGKRAIVYMPTQRSCGKVPINIRKIFNLKKIDDFCKENNAVFIIKKHFYHKDEKEDISEYSNIFDITGEMIDTQTLLFQADALISDYSACYIDYLLLNRPIILYAYDLQEYLVSERDLYLPFDKNECGFKAYTFDDVLAQLQFLARNNWNDGMEKGRNTIRKLYFSDNLSFGRAREEIKNIIGELLLKKYKADWGNEK